MPSKGTAFNKPGINTFHKAGSAKAAKVKAAAAAAEDESELSKELTARVQDSKMEDKRKTQALKHIGEALEKLRIWVDPLSGLTPPPDCRVCAGNVKGTHHFLCRKRLVVLGGLLGLCFCPLPLGPDSLGESQWRGRWCRQSR